VCPLEVYWRGVNAEAVPLDLLMTDQMESSANGRETITPHLSAGIYNSRNFTLVLVVSSNRTQLQHLIAAAPSTVSLTAGSRNHGLHQRCFLPPVQVGAEPVRLPSGGLLLPLQMLLWLPQNSKRRMTATRTRHMRHFQHPR
jgi:hypothetical protein